jgi:hypothetical protein
MIEHASLVNVQASLDVIECCADHTQRLIEIIIEDILTGNQSREEKRKGERYKTSVSGAAFVSYTERLRHEFIDLAALAATTDLG